MKEFIEKLIGRLEEKVHSYYKQYMDDIIGYSTYNEHKREITGIIEIVNKLSEEYINTSTDTSSGWIACSERLPEESNDYLVTQYNENAIDDYCDGYRVSTIFFDDKNGWWDDIDDMFGWSIIAWQPRPDVYKEGVTENEQIQRRR